MVTKLLHRQAPGGRAPARTVREGRPRMAAPSSLHPRWWDIMNTPTHSAAAAGRRSGEGCAHERATGSRGTVRRRMATAPDAAAIRGGPQRRDRAGLYRHLLG